MPASALTSPSTLVGRVVNDAGRAFNIVLVRGGDRYGLNDCLVNEAVEPMVEFYDATYEDDERFVKGRGQFVARYYLSTLTERRGGGLDLCGHEPAWKVTGQNVAVALAAVKAALHGVTKDVATALMESEDRERAMFGCTEAAIDAALVGKEPRDIVLYAMGTLSNAQELIGRGALSERDADTIRQLMNVAKHAMNKAVPR